MPYRLDFRTPDGFSSTVRVMALTAIDAALSEAAKGATDITITDLSDGQRYGLDALDALRCKDAK
jgi:hypothetical protein